MPITFIRESTNFIKDKSLHFMHLQFYLKIIRCHIYKIEKTNNNVAIMHLTNFSYSDTHGTIKKKNSKVLLH